MPQTTDLSFDLLPEVRRFLALSPVPAVIGGRDVTAASGGTFRTYDPGSGALLAQVTALQTEDVDAAVEAARRAFAGDWGRPAQMSERVRWMRRLADALSAKTKVRDHLQGSVKEPLKASLSLAAGLFFGQTQRL